MRMIFDQEKQKIVLLEKDKKLAEERLNSQTRTTQLVAIAGLTGLVTAFFLGYALLRRSERVTPALVAAAILGVAGTAFIVAA